MPNMCPVPSTMYTTNKSLSKEILAIYRFMQYGVNSGGGCRAEFLLKIHIRDRQVSRGLSSSPDN